MSENHLKVTKVKWVRVDTNPTAQMVTSSINLEDELAQVSCLLVGIQDEAIAAAEWVRVIDTHIWDVKGWVWELRKRVKVVKQQNKE